jgi:SAM-dependent methyltransferase
MLTRTEPVNHWRDDRCAKAFWGQKDILAYQQLHADTLAWAEASAGERWLDLGCGGGQLSRGLWLAAEGGLDEVVGLDCAACNERAYERLRRELGPESRVRFLHGDFSNGLAGLPDDHFDGVVSGLALTYAESYCAESGRWTTAAYDRALAEAFRVLAPGGRFVFSVNVPEPSWLHVAWHSLRHDLGRAPNRLRYLQKLWRMYRYGGWLKREARKGRFHYLPVEQVVARLASVGFVTIEHRLAYAGQAYLLRAARPAG